MNQIPAADLDLLYPDAVRVHAGELEVGTRWFRGFVAIGYPRQVTPGWLLPLLEFPRPLVLALYTQPLPPGTAMADLNRRLTWQRGSEAANQRLGRLTNPHQETAIEDAERLRRALARGDTRMLEVGLYLGLWAESREELERATELLEGITQSMLLVIRRLRFQQLAGFRRLLPLGDVGRGREMDSQAWSTLFPLASQDLADPEGQIWGINPATRSLLVVDRFRYPSPHSVTIGWSGAGKSYWAKLDAIRSRFRGWEVAVVDPEGEYRSLAKMGATVVTVGESQNGLDFDPFSLEEEWEWQVDFIGRLCRRLVRGFDERHERAWVRAAWRILALEDTPYRPCETARFPAVQAELAERDAEAAELMAVAQAKWRRLVGARALGGTPPFAVYDLHAVPPGDRGAVYLALAEMLARQTQRGRRRLVIFDEAWHLLNQPETAPYLEELFRRARKWNTALSLLTQDFGDFVRSAAAEVCLRNAPLVVLLRQHAEGLAQLAAALKLHEGELEYLHAAGPGEGILVAGDQHVRLKVWAAPGEARIVNGEEVGP